MNIQSLFGAGFLLLLTLIFCAFFGQRALTRPRKRKGHSNPGFFPAGTSLGNVLHQLQSIVGPDVLYSIQQQLQEADEEDDADSSLDPQKRLLGQATRIRRGTQIEPITAVAANFTSSRTGEHVDPEPPL
jgi:hypothetical protein